MNEKTGNDKTFTLFFKDGRTETVQGKAISSAFIKAGYGISDMCKIAFHSDISTGDDYTFERTTSTWVKNI